MTLFSPLKHSLLSALIILSFLSFTRNSASAYPTMHEIAAGTQCHPGQDPANCENSCEKILSVDAPNFSLKVTEDESDQSILDFSGALVDGVESVRVFEQVLAGIPTKSNLVLRLNSTGGSIEAQSQVIKMINAHIRPHTLRTAKNGRITTYVPAEAKCIGACLQLFMMGDVRIAHPLAIFGFHRLSAEVENEPASYGKKSTEKILRSWGVKGILVEDLMDWGALTSIGTTKFLRPTKMNRSTIFTEAPRSLEM